MKWAGLVIPDSKSSLNNLASKMSCNNRRTILRGKETGQWLPVLPLPDKGTELLAQEFPDALLLQHACCPPDLPIQCDSCQEKFSVCHALQGKCNGLVISRHTEIQKELSDLASKAFPSAVRNKQESISVALGSQKTNPEKQESPAAKGLFQNDCRKDRGNILV
jgi:hypothetical protein